MGVESTHLRMIARQPIFDRELTTVGYEILYRHNGENWAQISDPTTATAQVVLNSICDIGLEFLVGSKRAYINFDREALLHHNPKTLPAERVVLEVLESVELDTEMVALLQQLADEGYTIALDDFIPSQADAAILPLTSIVKLDIQAIAADELSKQVANLRHYSLQLLAEKVETQAEYDHCRELGFDLFQGYFLCHPKLIEHKQIPSNRLATINLLSKLTHLESNTREVEAAIEADVSLSYRLLRYINSAFFGLRRQIDSIHRAVIHLGTEQLRTWASVLALSGMGSDAPNELMTMALVRARMSSRLAELLERPQPESYFMVGLFSVLDALIGVNMETIVAQLPLTKEIEEALIERAGPMGEVLQLCTAFEQGDWARIDRCHIEPETLQEIYLESIAWGDSAFKNMAVN